MSKVNIYNTCIGQYYVHTLLELVSIYEVK